MRFRLFWALFPFPWLMTGALLWLFSGVGGATFMVNDPADITDAVPGDGACETAGGNNVCTLRAAIMESNALPGMDTIVVPAGTYTLTIPGLNEDAAATGDLDITESVIIEGEDRDLTIVSSNQLDRIFHVLVPDQESVEISGLTITDGYPSFDPGGGISLQSGQLTLFDALVTANFGGLGGGVFNNGIMTITNVTFLNNISPQGGGLFNNTDAQLLIKESQFITNSAGHGGGLYLLQGFGNVSPVTMISTTVKGNGATFGGGMYVLNSRMVMDGSQVNNNISAGAGGGIYAAGAMMTVTKTTISANVVNSSSGDGGGISANGVFLALRQSTIQNNTLMEPDSNGGGLSIFGSSTIVNSTFSGNESSRGGGLHFGIGDHFITNTTIVSNTAFIGGGIYDDPIYAGAVNIFNSIVADNFFMNCENNGQIFSAGHNLDSGDSCGFMAPGDLESTDPLLGLLQDNGGPTWTHALLNGSPAIDAANNTGCAPTDQRGFTRPVDGDGDGDPICDMGAYEFDNLPDPTPTIPATPPSTPTVVPSQTPTPEPSPTATIEPPGREHYLPVIYRAGTE